MRNIYVTLDYFLILVSCQNKYKKNYNIYVCYINKHKFVYVIIITDLNFGAKIE